MEINGLSTMNIDNKDYWTLKNFSQLTKKTEYTIRMLIAKGNRLGKLKALKIGNSVYIEAEELFNYKFVTNGRPNALSDCFETFYLENGELYKKEKGRVSQFF